MAAAGVFGLCLWAYSGWWLVLAVSSVRQTLRQGIPFTLGWWGAVFPLGTFAGEVTHWQLNQHILRGVSASVHVYSSRGQS
jgi:tellurite resistance protein TehA-like permease